MFEGRPLAALYTIDPGDEIISVMVIKPRGGAYD